MDYGSDRLSDLPLMEVLEPGLILASGHYRNGVLLTLATAEWVGTALEQA